jgi:hypothetical protein
MFLARILFYRVFLIACFSLLVVLPPPAQAQVNPNLEIGLKPYGTYDGGNVDAVSMTNGNLSLRIPLFSYPQRGALPLDYYLTYDDKGWTVKLSCNTVQDTCTAKWDYLSFGVGVYVSSDSESAFISTRQSMPGQQGSFPLFYAQTPDGVQHQMMPLTGGGQETVDGTGIWANGVVPGGTGQVVARLRNGHEVEAAPFVEDTNGNLFNSSGDTLGRSFGSVVSTKDYTGCASSPQAIASASIVTFPGGRLVKYCFVQLVLQSNFGVTITDTYSNIDNVSEYTSSPLNFIQSVVVYNGTSWATSPSWNFEYNSRDSGDPSSVNYGSLTKITFPPGGSISYTWKRTTLCQNSSSVNNYSRAVATRTVDAQDGTGPHTRTYGSVVSNGISNPALTDPAGNQTVYTVPGLNNSCSLYVTQTQWYQGSASTGTLLKTETTDYQFSPNPYDRYGDGTQTVINVFPIRVTTIWPNGQTTKVERDYDSNLASTYGSYSYGNTVNVREYDYAINAPGPLLRTTANSYLAFSNSSYLAANLLNLLSSTVVKNGSGTQVAL